jgi:hypothetical protein
MFSCVSFQIKEILDRRFYLSRDPRVPAVYSMFYWTTKRLVRPVIFDEMFLKFPL